MRRLCQRPCQPPPRIWLTSQPRQQNKGHGRSRRSEQSWLNHGPCADHLCFRLVVVPALVDGRTGVYQWDVGLAFLPEAPKIENGSSTSAVKVRYSDERIRPFVIVGVLMFTGFALVQQTMGFRFQDALSLSTAETARVLGVAMMCSAAASLFAQSVVVQRTTLPPFRLLQLALPLLTSPFSSWRSANQDGRSLGP